jgi:glycosyltransferase involved in cell wall biosynthesis
MRGAACLHVTSDEEHDDMRTMGLTNPIAVIRNGVDIPMFSESLKTDSRDRSVLSLGRIHPKKGLGSLVRAWAHVERKHSDWRLRIVGPNEAGYAEELRELASQLNVERLSIETPVYGPDKFRAYRDADLFILPTLSENFGLTIAEALASGVPAICTKGAPWHGLETEHCGWWIDHGVESLIDALDIAMTAPREELGAMGLRGHDWMRREFSWDRIAHEMLDVYKWVLGTGVRPTSVRLV